MTAAIGLDPSALIDTLDRRAEFYDPMVQDRREQTNKSCVVGLAEYRDPLPLSSMWNRPFEPMPVDHSVRRVEQ